MILTASRDSSAQGISVDVSERVFATDALKVVALVHGVKRYGREDLSVQLKGESYSNVLIDKGVQARQPIDISFTSPHW